MIKSVLNIVSSYMGIDAQDLDAKLDWSEFGFNSISLTELAKEFETAFHVEISPSLFFMHNTIEKMANYIESTNSDESISSYDAPTVSLSQPDTADKTTKGHMLTDIAIIGIACHFPGAENPRQFFDNLLNKYCSTTELSEKRKKLMAESYGETSYRFGGFVEEIDTFDAEFFSISPREASLMDPQQRKLLEISWHAIEDAGYVVEDLNNCSVGVFVGICNNDYSQLLRHSDIDDSFIPITTSNSIIANRLSYFYNFNGPSEVIDTACSSSLVAVDHAVRALRLGQAEICLVSGANVILDLKNSDAFYQSGMLASCSYCSPFSENAEGYIRSEGFATIVLKPYHHAIVDNDNIYAVIKGSAVNHGGHVNSLTQPKPEAQSKVILQACADASCDFSSLQYIEAHGTATQLGDPVEVEGLKLADRQDKRKATLPFCGLGSVKGNIGHCEATAGLAGIIKVALSFSNRILPPTIHAQPLNHHIQLADSCFSILSEQQALPQNQSSFRAGVSSFGFGGTNAHVVLEEHTSHASERNINESLNFLFIFSATCKASLVTQLSNMLDFLNTQDNVVSMMDVAFTLAVGRHHFRYRCAIIANHASLADKLQYLLAHTDEIEKKSVDSDVDKASFEELTTAYQKQDPNLVDQMLAKLKAHYLSGHDVCWKSLYNKMSCHRISLPTYPFQKTPYWYTDRIKHPVLHENKNLGTSFKEVLTEYLAAIIAEHLHVHVDKILANTELDTLGMDSIVIVDILNALRSSFKEVDSSIFFERKTITDLVDYFFNEHVDEVRALFTGLSASTTDSNDKKRRKFSYQESTIDRKIQDDIAIIGIAGRYPQANNLEVFWQNLVQGKDCVSTVGLERWPWPGFFNEAYANKRFVGGFIDHMAAFDPAFFSISPADAKTMDPQERHFLEVAWETVESAAYSCSVDGGTGQRLLPKDTSVFVGVMYGEYELYGGSILSPHSKRSTTSSFYAAIPNRVSHFMGLEGPSFAVDSQCSSSLTSIHLACMSLHLGECEFALAGGVNITSHPYKYSILEENKFLSSSGRCNSFGEGGDGYVPSEGVGAVLLKPLSAALKDRDFIYAVIKGSAINHGGNVNSYTKPNPLAQASVINKALERSHFTPEHVSYIEAHGTGTALGDPIEIRGLNLAYGHDAKKPNIPIGSVKSNLGHLESAAGIAALTKVVLQLQYKQLVPSIHANKLNPNIPFSKSAFKLQKKLTPWHLPQKNTVLNTDVRVAGVSSFGAGGSNAHIILQEATSIDSCYELKNPAYLIVLSATNKLSLERQAERLYRYLEDNSTSLSNVSYTLAVGRTHFKHRFATVVVDYEELKERLQHFFNKGSDDGSYYGEINKSVSPTPAEPVKPIESEWLKDKSNFNEYKNILCEYAKLYVKGHGVHWGELFNPEEQQVIPLPHYVFQHDDYWAPCPDKIYSESSDEIGYYLHNFVEQPLDATLKPSNIPKTIIVFYSKDAEVLQFDTNPQQIIICVAVGQHYTKINSTQFEVDATKNSDFTKVLKAIVSLYRQIDAVIFSIEAKMSFESAASIDTGDIDKALTRCFFPLFSVMRFIAKERWSVKVIYASLQHELIMHCFATGFLKSLIQEVNTIQGIVISCESYTDLRHSLLSELISMSTRVEIIDYRNQKRYLQVLIKLKEEPCLTQKLSSADTYLITGGLGELGRIFALYLSDQPVGTIVLLGCSPLDSNKQHYIETLSRQQLEVLYFQADVSDIRALQKVKDELLQSGKSVTGILHAAGVKQDSTLQNKTIQQFKRTFLPKVQGTINLYQVFSSSNLKFMLCFSSIASVFGNPGQCDYASANSFMDTYMKLLSKSNINSTQFKSVNWPYWQSGGMKMSDKRIDLIREQTGIRPLDNDEGLAVYEKVIHQKAPNVIILPGDQHEIKTITNVTDTKPVLNLIEIISQVTGVSKEKIHAQTTFSDLGVDSISNLSLYDELRKQFGPLPETILYEVNTIGELELRLSGRNQNYPLDDNDSNNDRVEKQEDIAIIGLSGRYPMADTIEQYWHNLLGGVDCITKIPHSRWGKVLSDTYCQWGGFINGYDCFDPLFFNISPKQARTMDPQERQFLEIAYEALEDAGYPPNSLTSDQVQPANVGVYVGVMYAYYHMNNHGNDNNQPFADSSFSSIANRVSYTFNFSGPSFAVDSMCSSSLTALHIACQAIKQGECDLALAGGVNIMSHPDKYRLLCEREFLSKTGKCRSFAEGADGYVPGEGVGAVLLKPLSLAKRDGDQIYAVIKASALNHNAKTNHYTVPSPKAQAQLIQTALNKAQWSADTLSYIEAHGTGTALGDPIEMLALSSVLSNGSAHVTAPPCAIGSVKSNIGHLESAAGIAGLTKILLQMQHKQLVPSIHAEVPSKKLQFDHDKLKIQRQVDDWSTPDGVPRRAGLSSFGAGGANVHVLLEEYHDELAFAEVNQEEFLVLISAASEEQLLLLIKKWIEFIAQSHQRLRLADVSFTSVVGRKLMDTRLALVVTSFENLQDKLHAFVNKNRHGLHYTLSVPEGCYNIFHDLSMNILEKAAEGIVTNAQIDGIKRYYTRIGGYRRVSLPHIPFLRHQFWIDRSSMEVTMSTNNNIALKLKSIISDLLEIPIASIQDKQILTDYGFDSIGLVEFSEKINEQLHVNINPTDFYEYKTVDDLVNYIDTDSHSENTSTASYQEKYQTDKQVINTGQYVDAVSETDIAIVGVHGVFPGASDLNTLWQHIKEGHCSITKVPQERWDWESFYGDPFQEGDKTNVIWGGFIQNIDQFDPEYYGITMREAIAMDPQSRIFMDTVYEMLARHNAIDTVKGTQTGVFVGMSSFDYAELAKLNNVALDVHSLMGSSHAMLANRLSYYLNLHGPSEAIDTACSSSLVALHRGMQSIIQRECQYAIVGGVNLLISPYTYIAVSKPGFLSPNGQCRPFDRSANGFVRGEGCGAILLQPLKEAITAGNVIYGVLKASAVNHGGAANTLTSPNPSAQADLIERCYRQVDFDPATVGMIEAHGTGTALGDPIEFRALNNAFRRLLPNKEFKSAIGSLKANIGHLESAAGIASTIKTLLCLNYGDIPPVCNLNQLNPYLFADESPFDIPTVLQHWQRKKDRFGTIIPRRAGISSWGFGGTNAHVVMEEYLDDQNRSAALKILSDSKPKISFNKVRCWFDTTTQKAIHQHPFVTLDKTAIDNLCFYAVISPTDPIVTEHVIQGQKILPAAAQIDFVAYCCSQIVNSHRLMLRSLEWKNPIKVNDEPVTIIISFSKQPTSYQFEISDESGIIYSSGSFDVPSSSTKPVPNALADQQHLDLSATSLEHEDIYAYFDKIGINYGPTFSNLREVSTFKDIAVAKVTLVNKESNNSKDYFISPMLLDSAFQAIVGFNHQGDSLCLPVAINTLSILNKIPSSFMVTLRDLTKDNTKKEMQFDLSMSDSLGNVFLIATGFKVLSLDADNQQRLWKKNGFASHHAIANISEKNKDKVIIDRLIEIAANLIKQEKDMITSSRPFDELGIDSILVPSLISQIEFEYKIKLDLNKFLEGTCLSDVADMVKSQLATNESDSTENKLSLSSVDKMTEAELDQYIEVLQRD